MSSRSDHAWAVLLDTGRSHGLLNMNEGNIAPTPHELPMAFLVHEQFTLLHRLATQGARPRVELNLGGGFGPASSGLNTVAELKGSARPEEIVLLGAHLDSWDLGTGALDNGAGVAAVMEAARLLVQSDAKPIRTIRFVLFDGEEQGMLGSIAYVRRHQAELQRHSAVFVMDTGAGRIDGIALQGRRAVEPIFARILEPLKALGVTDTDLRMESGSDHLPFDAKGVPAFCMEQVQDGYAFHHHSETDTLDKVPADELHQAAVVLAYTAYQVANLPEMLPRER